MKLASFFIDLLVDAGSGQLTVGRLIQSMGQLEVVGVANVGVLYKLAQRIVTLNDSQVKTALSLENLTHQTTISAKSFQIWKATMNLARVDSGAFKSTVLGISKSIADLKFGEGPLVSLAGLTGIQVEGKNALQILEAIANNEMYKSEGKAGKSKILSTAGVDLELMKYLDKSARERAALRKEGARTPGISGVDLETYIEIAAEEARILNFTTQIGTNISSWFSGPFLEHLGQVNYVLENMLKVSKRLTDDEAARKKAFTPTMGSPSGADKIDKYKRQHGGELPNPFTSFMELFKTSINPDILIRPESIYASLHENISSATRAKYDPSINLIATTTVNIDGRNVPNDSDTKIRKAFVARDDENNDGRDNGFN